MCDHCDYIRRVTDLVLAVSFPNAPMGDIAQIAARIYALVRIEAKKKSNQDEKDYVDWFNRICEYEFQDLMYSNPIEEPSKFKGNFDFREHMVK